VLNMQINDLIFTIHFRWGIGLDLESTGRAVPTLIYDDEGTIEPYMYNGWSLRIPFLLFNLGVLSE